MTGVHFTPQISVVSATPTDKLRDTLARFGDTWPNPNPKQWPGAAAEAQQRGSGQHGGQRRRPGTLRADGQGLQPAGTPAWRHVDFTGGALKLPASLTHVCIVCDYENQRTVAVTRLLAAMRPTAVLAFADR